MSIFDRYCRAAAVVTPVKYERDSWYFQGIFCNSGNIAEGDISKRGFSNPHPRYDVIVF